MQLRRQVSKLYNVPVLTAIDISMVEFVVVLQNKKCHCAGLLQLCVSDEPGGTFYDQRSSDIVFIALNKLYLSFDSLIEGFVYD